VKSCGRFLLPAYAPCPNFGGACAGVARWCPGKGHVPRGFLGALGCLDEIELVLVAAEPGNPLEGETYEGTDPDDFLDRCAEEAYRDFDQAFRDSDRNKDFHRNIRRWILDKCFPNLDFYHQDAEDVDNRVLPLRQWRAETYVRRPGGRARATTCFRSSSSSRIERSSLSGRRKPSRA
jgi:hypothetical protein